MRWTYLSLFLSLLCGCNASKGLVDNVADLTIEIDHRETLNIGAPFRYQVIATLKSGAQKKIKDPSITQIHSDQIVDLGNNRAEIQGYLQKIDAEYLPCTISLHLDSFSFDASDSIQLNFKGPIHSKWIAEKGANGVQPRASTATLFSRDGLVGRDGTDGSNGASGPHFIGYLWLEENELVMALFEDHNPQPFFYRSTERDSIIFILNGADGGNGGNGGHGGDGKPGKENKPAGNGADGGNGGRAGDGGNGGSVLLFLHSDIDYMKNSISLANNGGQAGMPGSAGKPGEGGKGFKNNANGSAGNVGAIGEQGTPGRSGPPITISIVSFDPQELLNQE